MSNQPAWRASSGLHSKWGIRVPGSQSTIKPITLGRGLLVSNDPFTSSNLRTTVAGFLRILFTFDRTRRTFQFFDTHNHLTGLK